jgi:hypothetical protein
VENANFFHMNDLCDGKPDAWFVLFWTQLQGVVL